MTLSTVDGCDNKNSRISLGDSLLDGNVVEYGVDEPTHTEK